MREVRLGRRLGNKTELHSGIKTGEAVIVSGISGIADGDPVNARIIGESGKRK